LYCFEEKPLKNLSDFIRVTRNLIENTDDNSRREWPRLISTLQNLISDKNVYLYLSELKDDNKLIGFNVEQRKEEIFKGKLFQEFNDCKSLIFDIEDHQNFRGNITNILLTPFIDNEGQFKEIELGSIVYDLKYLNILEKVFKAYKDVSPNGFNLIWGNLLITTLYTQTYESRLVYSVLFERHPAILIFSKKFSKSKLALTDYIVKIQKEYVLALKKKFDDFTEIKQVKDQLYLYYIISERIYYQSSFQFLKTIISTLVGSQKKQDINHYTRMD
jgi:hypothetical protein